MLADRVYIGDYNHGYIDVDIPIVEQPLRLGAMVQIGDGSWLGENVVVVGASIGKNCVVGANSVVTHDIPDYSVAFGNPARVVKRWNAANGSWEAAPPEGGGSPINGRSVQHEH